STVARVVRERRGARVQGSIGFVVVVLVVEESFGVVEGVGAGLTVVGGGVGSYSVSPPALQQCQLLRGAQRQRFSRSAQ
ncbi:hypothetical protein, partial [Mycobacterium tuberculosis]|uniref:hypothetical protein n=1 Tax=Mycobacterium tuberculosis TaxID=1773 RepID=UPI001C013D9A